MKKSLIILSAMVALPLGVAVAGPDCKTKCAKKATTVAKTECAKSKCAKAEAVAVAKTECAKDKCDKATLVAKKECDKEKCDDAALVVADCNFNCEIKKVR